MFKNGLKAAVLAAVIGFTFNAAADAHKKWGETDRLTWGADVRVRLTSIDRAVYFPDGNAAMQVRFPNERVTGSPAQWLRVRTRFWTNYAINEDMDLTLRIANRWHYVSSHFLDPNNQSPTAGFGGTWKFPDEINIDQLKLTMRNVLDQPLTLTLGRQDVILGNGMVVLEGTPFDQGRGIYFDGLRATWQNECDKLDVFAFYSHHKDNWPVINDRNRHLRRGNTFLTGAYWTHNFQESLKTDLYYIYNQVSSDVRMANNKVRLHTFGARAFGQATELMDYSLEAAVQRGNSASTDMKGYMIDARIGYKLPTESTLQPKLNLQYTHLSGNDNSSAFTGWYPVAAEYPIWRDDLLLYSNGGNWTNLNQWRLEAKMKMSERVNWTLAWAYLRADTVSGTGRSGKTMGHQTSSFVDIKVADNWDMKFEAAVLCPNSFYGNDKIAKWFRIENVFRF